eukprot:TRINITY_DN598_c1_g1_i7.p1 TRINITY_DN598_c1_g1~~TRINITY_DN598_c1_g1_i7.p1  ORF type:complete len:388 (+),score=27.81 TRINITY_DN598_c1_g1_i7:32-1165(+)
MASTAVYSFLFWATILSFAYANALQRDDFPENFIFGVGSSAYQYEGAAVEDGKGIGIWDVYTHEGNAPDGSTGDITTDGYHRYREDVKSMSEGGFNAFRFSISWTRLIPDGRGKINPKGLQFYNNLINELLDHGIQPFVTLNHFDLPQNVEVEYDGWINARVVDDFVAFSEVCFREFGDRVKYWMTVNEPNAFGPGGYSEGVLAPKRCSLTSTHCKPGNSSTEPYLAVHNMLLAHSAVVKLYRNEFQKRQGGYIGIPILSFFYWPLTNKTQDIEARQRALDFQLGWIVEPLLYGHYPKVMQKIVGDRLPSFSESQKKELINSFDFLGLNHYSTLYIADSLKKSFEPVDYGTDLSVVATGKITSLFRKPNCYLQRPQR